MGMFSQTRARSPEDNGNYQRREPVEMKMRCKLTVPVGDVLVGDTGGHIEHDNTALAVDIVPITETTKLLLTSSVPYVELNSSQVLSSSLVDSEWEWDVQERGCLAGHTVVKARGCTSTPRVAIYFFSNSPVK